MKLERLGCQGLDIKTMVENLQCFLGLKETTDLSQAEKKRQVLRFADSFVVYGEGTPCRKAWGNT